MTRQVVGGAVRIGGRSYAQWEAAYWRWSLAHRHEYARQIANGRCVTAGQRGPVWFLGGNGGGLSMHPIPATRTCSVPAGRYVFLGVPSIDCSTVELPPFRARTTAGLLRCARQLWAHNHQEDVVAVDGVSVNPAGVDVRTPVFAFRMPGTNNFLKVPARTHGRAAVEGDATMLRPLRPGKHRIVAILKYVGVPPSQATYDLTVR